jgi:hypothetical protein
MLETPGANADISKIIRDHMYITPKPKPTASYRDGTDTDRGILIEAGLLSDQMMPIHVSDFTGIGGHTHRQRKARADLRVRIERIAVAIFGGTMVVAPMLIMTLRPSRLNSLLTSSLFVLVVALVLAVVDMLPIAISNFAPKDILTATAAYAAILVVLWVLFCRLLRTCLGTFIQGTVLSRGWKDSDLKRSLYMRVYWQAQLR